MKKMMTAAAMGTMIATIMGTGMIINAMPADHPEPAPMEMQYPSPYDGEWRVSEILSGDKKISVEDIDAVAFTYLKVDSSDGMAVLDIEKVDGSSTAYEFPAVVTDSQFVANVNELGISISASNFSYAEGCSFTLTVVDNNSERVIELMMEGSSFPSL